MNVWRNYAIAGFFVLCLLGLIITPHDPYQQAFFEMRGAGSSWSHWLGVDRLGQDFLSRVWRGAGNSALFAGAASFASMAAGALLLLVEQRGGRLAGACARSLAALGIAWPGVLIGLLVAVALDRSAGSLLLAVSLAGTPFAFRQARAVWLELTSMGFVEASRAIGGGSWHRFSYTLWPNLWPQIAMVWKLVFAFAMLELSALTYLGLAGDPNWAELGSLMRDGQRMLLQGAGFVAWPGLALCGALLAARALKVE